MPPRSLVTAAALAAILAGCSQTETGPASPANVTGVTNPATPAASTPPLAVGGPEVAKVDPKAANVESTPPNVPKTPPQGEPVGEPIPIAKAGSIPAKGNVPPPAAAPIDPLAAAEADLQARKFDDAIAKVEGVLKGKPDDRQALFALVLCYQAKAESMVKDRPSALPSFLKSAAAARKLRDTHKDLSPREAGLISTALYNEACSLALDGKGDAAMASLKEAFDAGFSEMELFAKDQDLDSLRKRPDFAEFQKGLGTRKLTRLFKDFKPFDFSFSLTDVDGKPVALGDLKGKVVIVDIWGTWCPPCRKEIPHLVDLYNTYHDKGLEIIGLNYDEDGPPEKVKATIKSFLTENKVPYRCAVGDEKTQAQVPDFEGYPTTLFIDRAGKVRLKLVGYQDKELLESIVKTLIDEK